MRIVRAIKLRLAKVFRFIAVLVITVSGLILVPLGLIIVALEDAQ